MHITVVYTAQLKAELGIAQERIELETPANLADVVSILQQKHHQAFSRLVLAADGSLLPSIIPCLNDQQVAPDSDQAICDGDTLTFLSAISGG